MVAAAAGAGMMPNGKAAYSFRMVDNGPMQPTQIPPSAFTDPGTYVVSL